MGYFEEIGWSPTIGDPTFIGWFTVFAYFITAILSFRTRGNVGKLIVDQDKRLRKLWFYVGWLFLFLALNKQLDLQSLLTRAAKHNAIENGWYAERREMQRTFIYLIIGLGIIAFFSMAVYYREHIRTHLLAFAGLCFLIVFVLVRASSFHHVDSLLFHSRTGGFKLNNILELSGIALVAINTMFLSRKPKNRKRARPRHRTEPHLGKRTQELPQRQGRPIPRPSDPTLQ